MLTSEEAWNEIAKIIKNIMERLRSDEERNRNLNHKSQVRMRERDVPGAAIMLKTLALRNAYAVQWFVTQNFWK